MKIKLKETCQVPRPTRGIEAPVFKVKWLEGDIFEG